jgi:hypothetical protein
MRWKPCLLLLVVVTHPVWLLPVTVAAQEKKPSPAAVQFFETKVRPLLAENCFECHGEKKHKGGLRLDSLSAMLEGGDQGPAIVPGAPEKSLLIKAINYDGELKMPRSKKLPREQIEVIAQWIKIGAPWPGGDKPTVTRKAEFQITDKDRAHWSIRPVKRPAAPTVKNQGWVKNPIDAFILAKLEAKGLAPAPPASKQEIGRRLYYDITGLPPTPHEIEAFVSDKAPDAYEKLVEKLLASPHYGEKWGRHWLDLVRYAETNSYERDNPKPNAWRYRDYVIRAFNEDKPYDRFLREQLAGDELYPGDSDALIATGFYRLGVWDDEPSDPRQSRYDGLDDIIATIGQTCLGMTLDCARCHNHKIDPIAQKDYYRILAFLHGINHYRGGKANEDLRPIGDPKQQEAYRKATKELEEKRVKAQAQLGVIELEYRKFHKDDLTQPAPADLGDRMNLDGMRALGKERFLEWQKLQKQLNFLRKPVPLPPVDMALCVTEKGTRAPDTFVMLRGNPAVAGDKVEPGFPFVFSVPDPALPRPRPDAKSSGRRTVLADWLADKANPRTARVMANRLWQYHFGRGIVRTPNDYGVQGMPPTHPELLDWLASEFVEPSAPGATKPAPWSMKAMHRLILNSNAYRMASRTDPISTKLGHERDVANDLFWRFDMRRLGAEEIRDSILAVSGNLNLKMYGPGVYPPIPKEVLAGQSVPGRGWPMSKPADAARRSVYVHVKRSLLLPLLEAFDLAEADRTTPVRFTSTQPTQALSLINGEFMNQQAKIFAERLQREAGKETTAQVRLGLYLATSRPPSEADVRRGTELIDALRTKDGLSADAALQSFCLVVLNLNEFIYLD